MPRQNTDQLYIEIGYFTPEEYYVYTAEAQAAPTSSFSLSISVGGVIEAEAALTSAVSQSAAVSKTVDAEADFTSTFTQTAAISHIEGADLFAFTEASIAVQIDRIRDNNAAVSDVFDVATDFVVARSADADVDALFSAIIDGLRSRDYESSQSAAFSFTASLDGTLEASSTVSSNFDFAAILTGTIEGSATLSSTADVVCAISHIEGADITSAMTFDISVNTDRIRGHQSNVNAESALSADAMIVQVVQAALSSSATVKIDPRYDFKAVANLSAQFSAYTSPKFGSRRPYNLVGEDPAATNISTTQKKSGTYSLALASGRIVRGPTTWATQGASQNYFNTRDFYVSANENFVVEGWFYFTSLNLLANSALFGVLRSATATPSYSSFDSSNGAWVVGFNSLNRISFKYAAGGGVETEIASANLTSNTPLANTWTHIAFRRINGNTLQILLDNSVKASTTFTGALIDGNDAGTTFYVVNNSDNTAYVDEVSYKVSTGTISGYASQPIANDPATTVGLYHFESIDDAGNDYVRYLDDTGVTYSETVALQANTGLSKFLGGLLILANSSASSTFTVNANVDAFTFIEAAADISSEFTVSSSIDVVKPADANVSGNFALSAIPSRNRDVTSNQSAEFTESVDVEITRDFDSQMAATTDVFCIISHIEGADIVAANFADLTATAVVLRSADSNQNAEFTQTAIFDRTRDYVAAVSSDFAQVTNAVKSVEALSSNSSEFVVTIAPVEVVDIQLDLPVQASLSAFVEVIEQFEISINSEFTVYALGQKDSDIVLSVFSDVALTATASVTRTTDSQVNVSTEQTVAFERFRDFNSQFTVDNQQITEVNGIFVGDTVVSSEFALSASISHIEGAEIVCTDFASVTCDAIAGKLAQAQVSAEFSIAAINDRTRTVDSANNITADIVVAGSRTRDAVSNQSTEFTSNQTATVTRTVLAPFGATVDFTCVISHIEGADIVAQNFASINVVASRTRNNVSTQTSAATVSSTITKFVGFSSNQTANAVVQADADVIKLAESTLVVTSILVASVTVIKQGNINISSAMQFVAAVREIDLDTLIQYIYVIPKDIRTYNISIESRSYNITQETRLYKVRRT